MREDLVSNLRMELLRAEQIRKSGKMIGRMSSDSESERSKSVGSAQFKDKLKDIKNGGSKGSSIREELKKTPNTAR